MYPLSAFPGAPNTGVLIFFFFFFSSRRRHTRSVSAFLLNRSSDLTKLSLLPKKLFRIRMSRNFRMKMLTMTNLSTECLIQLTKLGYDATPFNQILKQNAKREMRLRLGKVTVADVRSEERRVGKECRAGWARVLEEKNNTNIGRMEVRQA